MSSRPRVLVTDAEIRKTLAVVRALTPDFEVFTSAAGRPALAAWSRGVRRHLRQPPADSLADWLVETARREGVELLFCPQETTLIRAGEVYGELEALGVGLTFPAAAILDRAFDKGKTLDLARRVGVTVPESIALDRFDEAPAAARRIGYPVVVKPRYSAFWTGDEFVLNHGPGYAEDRGGLDRALSALDPRQPPPIVQEFVPGRGEAVFLLLDRAGEVCAAFAHQRLRDVRPTGSGSVLRRSAPVDQKLLAGSRALLGAMDWWGIAMVEFRVDERTGAPLLMEVNGRFWGSLQLAVDAGIDFPRLLAEVARGGSPRVGDYGQGVAVRWWLGDLLRTLRVLKGKPPGYPGRFPSRLSALRDLLGPQPENTRGEVLRASDPWPAVAELLAGIRRIT